MSTCHESADLVRAVGSPAQCQPLSLASAHQLVAPASLLGPAPLLGLLGPARLVPAPLVFSMADLRNFW